MRVGNAHIVKYRKCTYRKVKKKGEIVLACNEIYLEEIAKCWTDTKGNYDFSFFFLLFLFLSSLLYILLLSFTFLSSSLYFLLLFHLSYLFSVLSSSFFHLFSSLSYFFLLRCTFSSLLHLSFFPVFSPYFFPLSSFFAAKASKQTSHNIITRHWG